MLTELSPSAHVSSDAPPTILVHGDRDRIVPLQQSQVLIDRLRQAGVPARLVVRAGVGHADPGWEVDTSLIADWFDQYLRHVR